MSWELSFLYFEFLYRYHVSKYIKYGKKLNWTNVVFYSFFIENDNLFTYRDRESKKLNLHILIYIYFTVIDMYKFYCIRFSLLVI